MLFRSTAMLKKILVFATIIIPFLAQSQNQTIQGRVTDESSETALPGAHVLVVGTTLGTVTNANGEFSFNNITPGNKTLRISFSGYSTSQVNIDVPQAAGTIEIKLEPVVFDINQVVVTGTRSPKTLKETPVLTQVISSAALESSDLPTIETALERTVPGIEFSHGAYGASIQMMGLDRKSVV